MTKRHISVFGFNHISVKLSKEKVDELKSYYQSYHRKCWAFKQAIKRFKKWKIAGNSLSVLFASGGLVSAIATSGISLVAISTTALLIQGWMKHKNLDLKIQQCIYAFQTYQHLLNNIKNILRSGDYDPNLYMTMTQTDDFITDNSPIIDKWLHKYDKYFIEEIPK